MNYNYNALRNKLSIFDMGRGTEVAEVILYVGVWGRVCNLDKYWQQIGPYI